MGLLAGGGALAILEDTDVVEFGNDQPAVQNLPVDIDYTLVDFDEVSTVGPQDIVITQGETFAVRSEGSPRALEQLEAVVENGGLLIRPKDGAFFGDWGSLESATFYITMPQLNRVALAGSGDIRINDVKGESFAGVLGGAGQMQISGMDVQQAEFGIFGAGDLSVNGTADDVSVTIGGAGEVDGDGLRSRTASVSIGGSGEVALTVEEEAKISITGSGDVDIFGPAYCSVTRMGGGDVSCEGGGGDED